MYSEGLYKFGGSMFTGFSFTSLVIELLAWPSYYFAYKSSRTTFPYIRPYNILQISQIQTTLVTLTCVSSGVLSRTV